MGTAASPKRRMPARSPSASASAAPEHERHVLDRVVLVDLEVAGRPDVEVDQAVVRERRRAGGRRSRRRSRSRPRPCRRGRARRDRRSRACGGATLTAARAAVADVERAERRGHAGSPSSRLAGGLDQPLVLVRVADGEAQVSASGVAVPNVRGTMPRRRRCSARRPRRSGVPNRRSRKFVTLGPRASPPRPAPSASRSRSRDDAGDVRRRGSLGRAAPRSRSSPRSSTIDPGGR